MNVSLERYGYAEPRKYLRSFIFTSTLFCFSLLMVLLGPWLSFPANQLRWAFFFVWLIAPMVGYLYSHTIAEHLQIPPRRIRWITGFSALQCLVTLAFGLWTFVTNQPLLFSYDTAPIQSRIDVHLGGVFSPNSYTVAMVLCTSTVVILATVYFLGKLLAQKDRDFYLIVGVVMTAVAIVVELLGYILQWPFIFSLIPFANVLEVVRITYLRTISAGRHVEQAALAVRRDKLQIREHLTALAHDINTPLTTLKLTAGRMKGDNLDSDLIKKFTSELEYMHVVSANLLTLFQLELTSITPTRRDTHVARIIDNIALRFEQLATESKVVINVVHHDDEPVIACDATILEQTISNLCYNAITHAQSQVTIVMRAESHGMNIEIIDDGSPVPSFSMPSLSDRAYRSFLENQIGCPGWSLGVLIAKAFADLQGGSLEITTLSDGQTSIKLALKCSDAP